jgi:hypothetical protein
MKKPTFKENHIQPGIQYKNDILKKGNQPPQNKTTNKLHINIIDAYLLKRKKQK